MTGLTQRQRAVFEWIVGFVEEHGVPPTVREIGAHFGISSAGVFGHLKALERKGYIRRGKLGARSLEVTRLPAARGARVPVVGQVAAGQPSLAVENVEGRPDLMALVGAQDTFALRVEDDAMAACGIAQGDYVIVSRSRSVDDGSLGLVYIDGEPTVRKVFRTARGYRLEPANEAVECIEVDDSTPGFRMGGRVVAVFRQMS